MTDLLLRVFVKNYRNTSDPAVRAATGKLAGAVGIFVNLLLFLGKLGVGLLARSLAIVADAVNNLSDAAASVITLLGFRLARKPADCDHPFGHARIEYLSGLAVSAMILLIGLELGVSSVRKILNPGETDFSLLSLGVLLGSMGVKYWMARFFDGLGQRIQSTVLKATALDSRNDALATAAVVLGCLLGQFGHIHVDGYVGLGVAVFIFCSGIGVASDTISPLLGQRADPELVRSLKNLVLSHEKILGVHDVLVHDYGPGQCFASLHAELSAQEEPLACHDIIDDIECEALARLNVHLVIHYDPVETDDEEWLQMHGIMAEIIESIDPRFSFHDFRLVRGAGHTKLVFDLAVPYGCEKSHDEIKVAIYEGLLEREKACPVVIRFDAVP